MICFSGVEMRLYYLDLEQGILSDRDPLKKSNLDPKHPDSKSFE